MRTSTGVPTRSTWNEIPWSVWCTADTVVVGSRTVDNEVDPTGTRAQLAGPSAAGTTPHRSGWSYQSTAGVSQLPWPGPTPFHTTGWAASGTTNAESAIR